MSTEKAPWTSHLWEAARPYPPCRRVWRKRRDGLGRETEGRRPIRTASGLNRKSVPLKSTLTNFLFAIISDQECVVFKTWKHPKRPSMEEWVKKMWYIYTREY